MMIRHRARDRIRTAEHDAKIAIHYHSHADAATQTLAKVRACGGDGFVVQADMTRPAEIRQLFGRVERGFGKLDIL